MNVNIFNNTFKLHTVLQYVFLLIGLILVSTSSSIAAQVRPIAWNINGDFGKDVTSSGRLSVSMFGLSIEIGQARFYADNGVMGTQLAEIDANIIKSEIPDDAQNIGTPNNETSRHSLSGNATSGANVTIVPSGASGQMSWREVSTPSDVVDQVKQDKADARKAAISNAQAAQTNTTDYSGYAHHAHHSHHSDDD